MENELMGSHLDVLRDIVASCPGDLQKNTLFMFGCMLINKPSNNTHSLPDKDDDPLGALQKRQSLDEVNVKDLRPQYSWVEIETVLNHYTYLGIDDGFLVTNLILTVDEVYEHLADGSDSEGKKD